MNKMPFRQFQSSEGGTASKAVVIGATGLGSGCRANIHDHVADMRGACCADVKRKYRRHALQHHSDKDGCDEDFYKLTNAKEQALKTCNPCSHNSANKHTHPKYRQPRTKHRQPRTSSKKEAKKRRKAKRKKEEAKRRKEEAKRREPKTKHKQHKQHKQRKKDVNRETKVSATSAAIVVGGLVLASGGPGKKKKKKLLRQTSIGRQNT